MDDLFKENVYKGIISNNILIVRLLQKGKRTFFALLKHLILQDLAGKQFRNIHEISHALEELKKIYLQKVLISVPSIHKI